MVKRIIEEGENVKKGNKKSKIKSNTFKQKRKIEKIRTKIYFGYTSRFIINSVLFISFLLIGVIFFLNSFDLKKERLIKFNENSKIDYKVYLLPNDFYETPYLEKNMVYVSSLIDKIHVDFDYIFYAMDELDMNFSYSIMADLIITNKIDNKELYRKNYVLLENQNLSMLNNNVQNIKEQIDIDYIYYNSIANKFRATYGVDSDSKLIVYLSINKKNDNKSHFELNENSKMSVTIPLSEKTVDVKLDYNEINDSSTLIKKDNTSIKNIFLFAFAIINLLFSIILLVLLIRKLCFLKTKKSNYDKQLHKYLNDYDRMIVETKTLVSFENKEIIKIDKFNELMDIHDNLQTPIIYYSVTNHHKSYFYINSNDIIYLFVLKSIDLEKKKNASLKK